MKKGLSPAQRRRLKKLADLPEREIDLSDIPEITDWSNAVRGRFYRPVKKPITIRLDVDVIAWLWAGGKGYQTRINQTFTETDGQGNGGRVTLRQPGVQNFFNS
jgi:uncharacterized protein (DUF4415 family)